MRRPLLITTVFFALGILIEYLLEIIIWWILPFFAMSIFLYHKNHFKKENCEKSFLFLLVFFFFFGMVITSCHNLSYEREYSLLESENASFYGRAVSFQVKEVDENTYKYSFLLIKRHGPRILVSGYESGENILHMQKSVNGAFVNVVGKIEKPRGAGNPRCFDYQLYLKGKRTGLLLKCSDFQYVKIDAMGRILRFLCNCRDSFFYYMEEHIGKENSAMTAAMLFGDKTHLDEETYKEFQLNGTAHVLATSGLHLGIIYAAFNKIFSIGRKRYLNLLLIIFFICYIAMANFSASIIRAALMITVSAAGKVFHRQYDMQSSIALSAFLLLLWNPYNLLQTGFQMSFLAVYIIAASFSKLERLKAMETYSTAQMKQLGEKKGIGDRVKEGFITTGVIQLSMTPYMIYTFNYISLSSFAANLPVTFLASYLLLIYLGSMVFFIFFGTIPQIGIVVNKLSTSLFVNINSLTYAKGMFTFDMTSPGIFGLSMIYIFLFFILNEETIVRYIRGEYRIIAKRLVSCIWIAFVISLFAASPLKDAQVVFLDVGQGDAVHMKSGKYNILIDGGGSIHYNIGEKTLKQYLLKNGVKELDLAAATHLHTDHFKGLEELAKCYPVEELITEGRAGQKIELGSDSLEILWPNDYDRSLEDENLNSLIFKATIDGITYLITGDITAEGEMMLLEKYKGTGKLKCDVLKIAHHGSEYSSCSDFLDEVNPEIAIISVGKNNYGHPSQAVLKRLEEKNIKVFRTDEDGAVGVSNRKGKIVCSGNLQM